MRSSGVLGGLAALFRWLGTPVRAVRSLFPFTHEGRQTLIYLIFAGAGPALTMFVWLAMDVLAGAEQWPAYVRLATMVAIALLIIVTGLGMFVSIRALKIGRDGFEAQGGAADRPPVEP